MNNKPFFSCLYSLVYPSSEISCCYNTSRRCDISSCNHLPLQLKSGSMGNSSENLRPHENQVWIKEVNEIVIRLRTVYILCNGFWENKYFVLPTLNVKYVRVLKNFVFLRKQSLNLVLNKKCCHSTFKTKIFSSHTKKGDVKWKFSTFCGLSGTITYLISISHPSFCTTGKKIFVSIVGI